MNSLDSRGSGNPEPLSYDFFPPANKIEGEFRYGRHTDFTIVGLDEKLEYSSDTFFLEPEAFKALNLGRYLLQSTHFVEREDWLTGREDSAQGVFFGELNLRIDDGSEHTLAVACKPYTLLKRTKAIHEYVALNLFHENPNIKSFNPLGFWVDSDGTVTLLSYFEEDVKSLDNIDWSKIGQNPSLEDLDLVEALQISARTLARLHAIGFAHLDAQIKNMAMHQGTGNIRLTDLTTIKQVYSTDYPDESYEWGKAVYADLHRLVQTVLQKGYLLSDNPKHTRAMIDDALIAVHASYLRHPANRDRLPIDSYDTVSDIGRDILANVA